MSTVYKINKGINRPLEFKGLKAQYIMYLAIGLVCLLLTFAIGYVLGVPVYLLIAIVGGLGFGLFTMVFKYSHKYGEHGLMKIGAYRQVPSAIITSTRQTFLQLKSTGK